MNATVRWIGWLAAAAMMGTAAVGVAHEGHPQVTPAPQPYAEPPVALPHVAPAPQYPTVDPLMRALIIGIAANILREAAAQPDPVEALGNAVERRIVTALADPNTMRLVESALRHAFQDAPVELREPLALFASSVLHNMRNEMLRDMRPPHRH
jgi:hypothetical protein